MINKKLLLVTSISLVLLLAGLSLSACSSPAAPPATPPAAPAAPAAPATPPAAAKVFQLKHADLNPPTSGLSQVTQKWADMINQNSGGRLKVTTYFAESLLKTPEIWRGTQLGTADTAYYVIGNDPGMTELNRVVTLPFMGYASMRALTTIYEQLLKEFPAMAAEFQGIKVFAPKGMPGYQLLTTKKEVHVPADLKGMKIIARAQYAELMKNVGAAPMELGAGDWYTSLERGLAEGHVIHLPAAQALKTLELLKYHTVFGDGGIGMGMDMFIMNANTWNSLPPDLQKVIQDACNWRQEEMIKEDAALQQQAIEYSKTNNHVFYTPTPDEMKLWMNAAVNPGHEQWISANEAKGLPARAVYDKAKKLATEIK